MSQKQQHKKKPLKIFFVSLLQFEEEKSMFTQLSKERKSFDFPKNLPYNMNWFTKTHAGKFNETYVVVKRCLFLPIFSKV